MQAHALFTALLLGALVTACGREADLQTRSFELTYLDAEQAARIVDPYVYGDRPKAAGRISIAGNIFTIRETGDNLDRIARVLGQYDRRRPTVRLTFRMLEANGGGTADPAIADVEAVLRRLFRFRGYSLIAEGVVSGDEGSRVTQTLGGTEGPYRLTAEIRQLRSSGDSATVQLMVQLMLPQGEGGLETLVSLPAGKTAVLGNAGGRSGRGTLILTVRPDVAAN